MSIISTNMIIDLLQTIINNSSSADQIAVAYMDKYTYQNIYVYIVDTTIGNKINQDILDRRMFSKLKILYCDRNQKINNLDHLSKTLEELHCNGINNNNNNIHQNTIYKLNKLRVLNCDDNNKINDVNHLSDSLEELSCIRMCKIDQKGISKLAKLRKLDCSNNWKIKNVNHLSNTLQFLDCSVGCDITQKGISELKILKVLKCGGNENINNLDHLSETLEELDCNNSSIYDYSIFFGHRKECRINQNCISNFKRLKILNANHNQEIQNVNHLSDTLERLYCSHDCGINQKGISELNKLEVLDCKFNAKINSISHLSETLQVLYCNKNIEENVAKNIDMYDNIRELNDSYVVDE